MDNNSFWLFNFDNNHISASLVLYRNEVYHLNSIGPEINYLPEQESVVTAVDKSLSKAASDINFPEDQEPNNVALILPPFWVGSDGKIISEKRKLIEHVCRDLKLSPMGFIANDDAIVEDANHSEGFPASFVLLNINSDNITVSLTYLGKIIERITKPNSDPFDPSIIENCLLEFKSESTLPPQIIIIGSFDDSVVDLIKNYTWVGKKNIETFLHFPDIRSYSLAEVTAIYTRAITLQFKTSLDNQNSQNNLSADSPEEIIESTDEVILPASEELFEVSGSELGFITPADALVGEDKVLDFSPPKQIDMPDSITTKSSDSPIITKKKFIFPKIKLPHFKLPHLNYLLIPLVFSPLLILIPFFFSTAEINLYLTQYEFKKQLPVILDPQADKINLEKNNIPVSLKTFTINTSSTITTTGTKTTGEKARGEIVVYNKIDKTQNIPKGSVLIDDGGKKFETLTSVEVASSSSNLDAGVINLGQTKVMVAAAEIGPEYNLSKDARLKFKDLADTIIIAKVKDQLSGGSKKQVKAVSTEDKLNVDLKIKEKITTEVNNRVDQEIAKLSGLLEETLQIKKGRIEYSREVGEEADEITANSVNTATVYYFEPNHKLLLIDALLSSEDGYTNSVVNQENFNITLLSPKFTGTTVTGQLSIDGKSTPKIDIPNLTKKLSGKSYSTAQNILRTTPRVYDFRIDRNLSFLNFINPLPYRLQNITIKVK